MISTPDSSVTSIDKVIVAASVVTSTVEGDAVKLESTGGLPSLSRISIRLTVISWSVLFTPSLAVTVAV